MSVRGSDWTPKLEDPEVQEYIFEEAGEDALEIAAHLQEESPTTGVEILEAFGERKPSDVRKALYALMQAHGAEYERETDETGWETFIWRLDLPEIGLILRRRWADELQHLRKQVKFEQDHEFYACGKSCRRIVFEDAIDIDFHCPVCNDPMDRIDNQDVVAALQERLDELAAVVPA